MPTYRTKSGEKKKLPYTKAGKRKARKLQKAGYKVKMRKGSY